MMADFCMVSHKKAEEHYDYMIQKKKLPALKDGGQTVLAQPTTTNQTATTTAKLLRNHANFVAALEMVHGFNDNLAEYTQVEDFSVLTLTRPTLWLLRVLCLLLEIRTRKTREKLK